MDIITSTVNGYTVIGTIDRKYVWRVAGKGTKVAFQSGGSNPVTGAPRWAEVKPGDDTTGMDLYEIV